MRKSLVCELMRAVSRFAVIGAVGGLAAACSTDSVRLSQNPFSNPFGSSGAASPDPSMTGSIEGTPPSVAAMPRGSVQSAPLAPLSAAPVSSPVRTAAPAPSAAPRMTSNGPAGWSAQGGTNVIVAPGETVSALSTRYGVPESAILSANGLSGARDVSPGRRLVIPVYSATGTAQPGRTSQAPSEPEHRGRVVATSRLPAKSPFKVARADPAGRPVAETPRTHPRPGQTAKATPAPITKSVAKAGSKAAQPRVAQAEPIAPAKTVKPEKVAAAKPEKVALAKPEKVAASKPEKLETKAQKIAKVEPSAPVPEPVKAPAAPAKEPENTGALVQGTGSEFRWPARGRVIAGFGGSGGNEGINIAVPDGTPVKAAGDGTVAYAGSEVKGYGNLVLIRHENGYVSAYAHNGDVEVKRGQKVTRGQTIAKSGQSGNVTSPQLHFEIRKGSTPVDPMRYLASN